MNIGTRFVGLVLAAAGAAALSAVPARADIIAAVQFVSAGFPSSGNPLEVTLMNTGAPVTVASFTFQITTSDTDITFESTDISTTPAYIFAGDSLLGPTISSFSPGLGMDGFDVSLSGNGTVLGTGATFGLGRALFDVASGATPGSFAVSLVGAGTSLSDPSENIIPIDTLAPGQITITAVPEPASALLLISALGALVAVKRRRR